MTNVLALDIGAASGRAVVGELKKNRLKLTEVARFQNVPTHDQERLAWDVDGLMKNIKHGIAVANDAHHLKGIGVTTWGVDFGLIGNSGQLLEAPTHFRDVQVADYLKNAPISVKESDLYEMTGNQVTTFNTLFQLLALRHERPKTFRQAKRLLLMPDLFNYLLTGRMATERSIAATTQLTDPFSHDWSDWVLEQFDLPRNLLTDIVDEGRVLGPLKPELKLGATPVINVCQHNTASAILSVPAKAPFLFVACGTWSLIGTERAHPILNDRALAAQLTNQSGHDRTTELLRNCPGLWFVEELKRNYQDEGVDYSYETITELVRTAPENTCHIDPGDDVFQRPGDLRQNIVTYAERTHQPVPDSAGEFFKCVYESLALDYDATIKRIETLSDDRFTELHLVGNGARSPYFCQLVADVTGKTVIAGPIAASVTGNVLMQLIAVGAIPDVDAARKIVRRSVTLTTYRPRPEIRLVRGTARVNR